MATYQMYIDGKFVDATSRKTFNVYDPATEEVIATCPAGDAKDIDRAAQAAKKAFYGGWKNTSAQERGRILLRLRRTDPGPARRAGRDRNPQLRQADRRVRIRHG